MREFPLSGGGEPLEEVMPWRTTGKLDDMEPEALYHYLHELSPTASR